MIKRLLKLNCRPTCIEHGTQQNREQRGRWELNNEEKFSIATTADISNQSENDNNMAFEIQITPKQTKTQTGKSPGRKTFS